MAKYTAIVLDFLPFGQLPRLSDILAGAAADADIISCDPTADLAASGDLSALAEGYARMPFERPVSAALVRGTVQIVGYCSAAAVTLLTGAAMRRLGHDTDVVLIQPTWPTTASVQDDFEKFRRDMGATAPTNTAGEGAIESMRQQLRVDMVRALGSDEEQDFLMPPMYQDLLDRYSRWLAFTAATAQTLRGLGSSPAPFRVITNVGDPAAGPWDADARSVQRLPVAEDGLMADPSLPDLVFNGKE